MSSEVSFSVEGGSLAALDFGGAGRPVLLVHGTGHNAAAWTQVAERLVPEHRVVAVDLRGHGHSTAESKNAEQYWRDLAVVVAELGWARPLLAGHSTGGYAVVAVTAAGLVEPAGICVVDGLVLDDRATATRDLAETRGPQMTGELRRVFGYGRRLDPAQREAWIAEQVDGAPTDWLNAGADPGLVRAVAARSVVDGIRRPTVEEVVATTEVPEDAKVHPSAGVYDRITCPLTVVLPEQGFHARRRPEVARLLADRAGRELVDVAGGHNVVMTHPAAVAAAIRATA